MAQSRLVVACFGTRSLTEARRAISETRVNKADELLGQWTIALELGGPGSMRVRELMPLLVVDQDVESKAKREARDAEKHRDHEEMLLDELVSEATHAHPHAHAHRLPTH